MKTLSALLCAVGLLLLLHAAAVAEPVGSDGTSTDTPAESPHEDCPPPDGGGMILIAPVLDGGVVDPVEMPEPMPSDELPPGGEGGVGDGEVVILPVEDGEMPPEDWCWPTLYDGENPPPEGEEVYYTMTSAPGDDVHHNPEPASLVLAGVGASLLSCFSLWRRNGRRR